MLFVILGSDRALAAHALARILQDLDPGGFDTDRIDASTSSFDSIFAAMTAAPFFGSGRVIVLRGFLTQGAGKSGRGKAKPDGEIGRLIGSLPETTTLVFFEPEIGEISAQVRKQLPADIPISANDAPRGGALVSLAQRLAGEYGSNIDTATARALLDRLFPGYWPQAPQNRAFDRPPSVELLDSEICKLALAAHPGPITIGLIDDLTPQRTEERIFPLLDAVTSGNQRGALLETRNALQAGEDASRTIAQIYQQIELGVGATAAGRPSDPLQAGRSLGGASAYRVTKVSEAASKSRVAPARQLRLALENDRKLKTGRLRNPDEALVDLVVRATQAHENR